jgi:Mg-chelatase subunit ChlD
MKLTLSLFVVFMLIQVTICDFCPQNTTRPDAEVNQLIQEIKAQSMESNRLLVLEKYINSSSLAFTGLQVTNIVPRFSFTDGKCSAVKMLNPYIIGMTTDDIINLLNTISFSNEKLTVLQTVATTLLDATDLHKQKIIDNFSMSSDKARAKEILANIVSRNCVFGTVTEAVAIFLIDLSGSMDTKFIDPTTGNTSTRLQFVSAQLSKVIAEQLKSYQKFNIIGFASTTFPWQATVVNATKDNIESAKKYISTLVTKGGTNLMLGLRKAFEEKDDLRGLYLLSDGIPNEGITDSAQIIKNLQELIAARKNKVIVNTTAFLLGKSSAEEKEKSAKLMRMIAESTGGVFRNMDMN